MSATLTDSHVMEMLEEVMRDLEDELFYDDLAKELILAKLKIILKHIKIYCADI